MKYLLLICCIGLFSCGDEEVLNVFIENQPNINKDFTPKIKYSTVSISGLIKNGEGLSVVLESPLMSNKIKLDSTTIDKDDKFNFELSIPEDYGYYILRLLNNERDSIELSLKGGDKISLNTTSKKFNSYPQLKGFRWCQDANQFQKKKSLINDNSKELSILATRFMKKNPTSPYNIILSKYFIGSEVDINEFKIDVFHNVTRAFIDSFPNSLATKNFIDQLDILVDVRSKTLGLSKGDYMLNNGFYDVPDIVSKTPKGGDISLSEFRGKYVLVDFWASWCGPCRKENPNVVKLYKKYRKNNFTVFSVSLDQDATKWKQAIQKDNLIWPNHASDLMGWNSSVVPLFNIQGIPYTILVNPEGKIIGLNLRGQELENRLKEIFKS